MGNGSDSVRRTLGVLFLIMAGAMLVLGQTAFKSSLAGAAVLVYWLVCFLLTFAAIFIALIDLRSIRRQAREETRQLFEQSLEEIDRLKEQKLSGAEEGDKRMS